MQVHETNRGMRNSTQVELVTAKGFLVDGRRLKYKAAMEVLASFSSFSLSSPLLLLLCFFFLFFETKSYSVAQASLKFMETFLPQPLEKWNFKQELPYLVFLICVLKCT